MGLLNNGISIIHFDETYLQQRELLRLKHEAIDCRKMEHVNLYCEKDSLHFLSRILKNRQQKGITFLGSGNYHYMTYLLLKEISKPFTLVLFDNHPDLESDQNDDHQMISCGSWVSHALRDIPQLQRVIIIGPTVSLEHYSDNPRTAIYPFDDYHHYSIKSILSALHTKSIYISIDKDVLNRNEALTNWDQGIMDITTLTAFLGAILKTKQVEGVDICGEARYSPANMLNPCYQTGIHKNEDDNLKILHTCLQANQIGIKGA